VQLRPSERRADVAEGVFPVSQVRQPTIEERSHLTYLSHPVNTEGCARSIVHITIFSPAKVITGSGNKEELAVSDRRNPQDSNIEVSGAVGVPSKLQASFAISLLSSSENHPLVHYTTYNVKSSITNLTVWSAMPCKKSPTCSCLWLVDLDDDWLRKCKQVLRVVRSRCW
jgi:hypothetical protein